MTGRLSCCNGIIRIEVGGRKLVKNQLLGLPGMPLAQYANLVLLHVPPSAHFGHHTSITRILFPA